MQFLRRIDLATRLGYWVHTEAASKGRDQPQLVPLHGDVKMNGKSRDARELNEVLAARQAKRQAELARMKGNG